MRTTVLSPITTVEPSPNGRRRGARLLAALALAVGLAVPASVAPAAVAAGPLPDFQYSGEVTVHGQLSYDPTGEFIFPSVFHAGEYLANPLGEWYLYYAPHENPGGVSLMYSDNLAGPWTEYASNPVVANVWSPNYSVPHVSSPDAIWNEQEQSVFLYFHGGNDQTRFATSDDGVTFSYGGTAVTNAMTGSTTTETSYGRVFEHPDPASAYQYGMFFMQNTTANVRKIRLAESVDGRSWTVRQNFVISPGSLDAGNVSGGNLWEWNGQLYVIYHASSKKTFARPVDATLTQIGSPILLHASSGTGEDVGRVASPEIVTDATGTYLFYEKGDRLDATIAFATAGTATPTPAPTATPTPTATSTPPTFALNTTVSAAVQCSAGAASLRVDAHNQSSAPVDIRITTAFGEKKFTGVSAGAHAVWSFPTSTNAVTAGQASAASFTRVAGTAYSGTTTAAYSTTTC